MTIVGSGNQFALSMAPKTYSQSQNCFLLPLNHGMVPLGNISYEFDCLYSLIPPIYDNRSSNMYFFHLLSEAWAWTNSWLCLNQLDSLKPKESLVIRQRYGLDGKGNRTLGEIAGNLNISREMVRKHEMKAMMKLKHPARVDYLRHYAF